MALITAYGSPFGYLPMTTGRYFFVSPTGQYTFEGQSYAASDNNDGVRPERALRTITYALSLTTANVGDVVVLLQGAHSVSLGVNITKAGVTVVGIPGAPPNSRMRRAAAGRIAKSSVTSTETPTLAKGVFNVQAADVELAFIHFIPPTQGNAVIISGVPALLADRLYIHDCTVAITGTAASTSNGLSMPLVGTGPVQDVLVSNCYFVSGTNSTSGANGPAVSILGTAQAWTIEQSTFELKGTAAWASAVISSNALSAGIAIRDCDFLAVASGTAITNVIDMTGQTIDGSTVVERCYFTDGSTKFVKATATPDIHISECYVANATSGLIVTK
jgi:hypothetical protein